jgi:3-amino-4-hydroxybenzoic acid synthase
MSDKKQQATKVRRPAVAPSSNSSGAVSLAAPAPATTATVHGAGETQWWFDARGVDDSSLLAAIEKANCTHIVIDLDQQKKVRTSKQKVVWVEKAGQLDDLEDGAWVFTPSEEIRVKAASAGRKAGLFIDVENLEAEFPHCVEVCSRGDDFVVIDIEHATYIPYELLLAKTEGKPTRVLRTVPIKGLKNVVDDVNQSLNAFATMERGIGVLFRTRSSLAVESLTRNLSHRQSGHLELVRAKVEDVQHTGLGHRVCVDTTSLMTAEEGMIIGSTGWGGIFVCSETHYLPHMNLREFRVNAGGVHSYIWGPNNNVMYLSEMKAGSEVLCVDIHGNSRVVTVGRAKIERRPLLKIRCSVSLDQVAPDVRTAVEAALTAQREVTPSGEKLSAEEQQCVYINTFLQNDWHVRIMGADGKIRHSTLVQPGDELVAHVEIPGRHTGLKVTEHIMEK